MRDTHIIVGVISGAFGVQGEVRLKSYCATPQAIADYAPLFTENGTRFSQIILTGQIKGGFSARLDGIVSKEDADALRNAQLYAARDVMPALPDNEYYYADLIGLVVLDTGGAILGTVRNVVDHGAGDLLDIAVSDQTETVLLPFTQAMVPTVDLSAKRIVADPPEGLF